MPTNNRGKRIFDEEIFMWSIWKVVFQRWKLFLLVAILCGIVAYTGTKLLIAPTYQASFTGYVNNSNQGTTSDTLTTADIAASRNLTSTYATIIKSQPDIEAALKDAKMDMDYTEIADQISVTALNDTEIIKISVVMTDPELAYNLATSLQKVAPAYVESIVAGSSMKVIAPANFPIDIYGPNYKRNALLGAILGALIAVTILFVRELSDKRVKSIDELNRYGIAFIGTVHDLTASNKHRYGNYGYAKKG